MRENRNTRMRKRASFILALLAVGVMFVGSLAYFTDKVTGQAEFTVMSAEEGVDIDPEPENPDPEPGDPDPLPDESLEDWWKRLNEDELKNFNPGDRIRLTYNVKNSGKLAVDFRETITLTSDKPLNAESKDVKEFQLVEGKITKDTAGACEVTGSEAPTSVTPDNFTVTYTLPAFSLKGSAEGAEEIAGITETSKEILHNVVFYKLAGNNFQNAHLKITYLIEARQHMSGAEWEVFQTETLEVGK